MRPLLVGLAVITSFLAFVGACGNDSSNGGEQTGQACTAPTQCYPGVDQSTLKGTTTCLTQVSGGYCTHTCQADTDCCAVNGECRTNFPQVCGPFESTGQTYCFLSCDANTISAAGYTD